MRSPLSQILPVVAAALFLAANTFAQTDTLSEPTILKQPQPTYPAEAKKTDLAGRVSVKVSLDEKGKVIGINGVTGPDWICPSVVRSDVVALRNAASESAKKATFSPAMKNGIPVPASAVLVYYFGGPRDTGVPLGDNGGPAMRMRIDPAAPKTIGTTNDQVPPMPAPSQPPPSPGMVAGGVLNGKALDLPVPVYPAAARAVRASGQVNVQVLIETDGTVFSAEPITGHPLLRSASQIAACGSKFAPTLLYGAPVKVLGFITYNFNL